MPEKTIIMDAREIDRALSRIAHEIVERNHGTNNLALVGIRTRGVPLAEALQNKIKEFEGVEIPTGSVDITLYRDDLYTGLEHPIFGQTELPFDLEGTGIVLVDDVLFTGRTTRAAMGVVHDYGRPQWVKLAVLVDRGHRELPIQADFVGRAIESDRGDRVDVVIHEEASEGDCVLLEAGGAG